MSTVFSNWIILCSAMLIAISSAIAIYRRSYASLVIDLCILCILWGLLYFSTGFPLESIQSFGNENLIMISIMFLSIVLGMISNYFFYKEATSFAIASVLKPIFVSPIVLLPLIGSIDGLANFTDIQSFSLVLLSFQNGFFWKSIFDKTQAAISS